MKRFSLLLAVAAMLLFTRPALAVNLHNGAIVVHNNTRHVIHVAFEHSWTAGLFFQYGSILPGKTFITDRCCFAAGSTYRMRIDIQSVPNGSKSYFPFTPHLCHHNGVPYGYAVIDVMNESHGVKEIDEKGCYMGPRRARGA